MDFFIYESKRYIAKELYWQPPLLLNVHEFIYDLIPVCVTFFENGACISYLAVIYPPYLTSPFLMSETYKNVA